MSGITRLSDATRHPAMRVRLIAPAADAVQPVTLKEARDQARVDCDAEDAFLGLLISVATQAATDRLQRALVPTRYRLTLDSFPSAIELLMPPIISVESVKYIGIDGEQQTLDPQGTFLDKVSEPGQLVPAFGHTWPTTQDRINTVEVEYTAGYPDSVIPTPIKQWILLAIGDMYANRERSAEKPAVPQDFAEGLLDTYKIWSV
jgi:uncharacterized phiE125 gp8 family phage protein